MLVMLDAKTESGLKSLLKDWGIILDQRVIVDASGRGQFLGFGSLTTFIFDYGAHPITESFTEGISLFPEARAIMTQPIEGIEAIALLITNDQSWAESDLQSEEVELNLNEDIPGPLDLGVALVRKESNHDQTNQNNLETKKTAEQSITKTEKENPENSQNENNDEDNDSTLPNPPEIKIPDPKEPKQPKITKPEAKMVVIGNSTFATDGWFQQQLNGDVFLNSVEWLANEETKTLSITPKEPTNRRLNITTLESGILGWLALLIMPALAFLAAISTWWKRR
jgi:ABC-type uncharacterized transport system involved in gliding motility auxiliary subunit